MTVKPLSQSLLILVLLLAFPPLLFSETASPGGQVSIKIDVVRDNLLQYFGFNIGDVLLSGNALVSSLSLGLAYQPDGQPFFVEAEAGISKTANRLSGYLEDDQIGPTASVNVGVGDRLRGTAFALDLRYFPSRHFVSNLVPMVEVYHKGFGLSFLYLPTWLFTNPTIAEQYFLGLSYSFSADLGPQE